jgi:hypothetical protein
MSNIHKKIKAASDIIMTIESTLQRNECFADGRFREVCDEVQQKFLNFIGEEFALHEVASMNILPPVSKTEFFDDEGMVKGVRTTFRDGKTIDHGDCGQNVEVVAPATGSASPT